MKSSRAEIHGRFHKIPRLVFTKDSRLTSYAGLVIFQAMFAALGLKKLRDLDYYRDDPFVARILGLRKLPTSLPSLGL